MRERHYTGFRIQGAIVLFVLIASLSLPLTGCKNERKANHSPVAGQVQGGAFSLGSLLEELAGDGEKSAKEVQELLGAHGEVLQQKTKDEIAKLFRWEYKVIELDPTLSAEKLEQTLQPLGLEGWECFQAGGAPTTPHLVCKRRPPSTLAYLKYIPGL